MRWNVKRLLHITLIACIFAASFSYARRRGPQSLDYFFGIVNLVLLTVASMGAYYSPQKWRRAWLAFAIIGWLHLIVMMRLFSPTADGVAEGFVASVTGALCAMLLPEKKTDATAIGFASRVNK
jgi:hypothetical protein